jgi:hypothetical protein
MAVIIEEMDSEGEDEVINVTVDSRGLLVKDTAPPPAKAKAVAPASFEAGALRRCRGMDQPTMLSHPCVHSPHSCCAFLASPRRRSGWAAGKALLRAARAPTHRRVA